MKAVSGIYRIIVDNKSYIGSSINVYRRFGQHLRTLDSGTNDNPKLQNAFNKTREVEFELLEELYDADADTLVDRENYYISKYHAEFNIYKAVKNTNKKTVYQFDLNGNLITSYSSIEIAANVNGISASNIMHAAQENETETRTAGGYFWRYVDYINYTQDKRTTNIYVYNIRGVYLYSFKSISDCIKTLFKDKSGDHHSRINRVLHNLSCSYLGYRFSYLCLNKLDNSQLLSVKKYFPVVQILPDKKTAIAIYEKASDAAKKLKVHSSCEITDACSKERKCKGYYWTRLGTKWSELLEYPEDFETTAQLETTNANV